MYKEHSQAQPQYAPVQTQYVPVQTQYVPVQAAFVANSYNYGSEPMRVTCFNCKHEVVTRTIDSVNALCCFIFGCWALCCCQNVEHRCPQCNISLGTYKPV